MPLKTRKGLVLDTGKDAVIFTSDTSLYSNKAITMEAWFSTLNDAYGVILGLDNFHKFLEVQSGGKLSVFLLCTGSDNQYTITYASGYADGNPHHFVAVYDSSIPSTKIYFDGNLVGSTSSQIGDVQYPSSNPFSLGCRSGQAGNIPFTGTIYETRVYDRALSADEVVTNYSGYVTRDGLKFDVRLDEGQGTTVHDYANDQDGTIYGARWTVQTASAAIKQVPVKPAKNLFNPGLVLPDYPFVTPDRIYSTYNSVGWNRSIYSGVYHTTIRTQSDLDKMPKLEPNTTYTLSFNSYANARFYLYTPDGTSSRQIGPSYNGNMYVLTFTTSDTELYFETTQGDYTQDFFMLDSFQLEKGDTVTSYERYKEVTVTRTPQRKLYPLR